MPNMLEVGEFLFKVLENGANVTVQQDPVNVLPQGGAKQDLNGWQGPVSYPEQFQEDSILGFSVIDFRIVSAITSNRPAIIEMTQPLKSA
jgi:hypothetical protein